MAISTIVGTIDTGITLNNVAYATPLTLLSTGAVVAPTGSGIDVTVNNARIFNAGYIEAAAGTGISFAGAGYVFNQGVGAYISGQTAGIEMSLSASAAGTIINQGTIAGTGTNSAGLYFNNGTVRNEGSLASISGTEFGIGASIASIFNQGGIYSSDGFGVELKGGSVTNSGTLSSIQGHNAGIGILGSGFASNHGTITGVYAGIGIELGGTIENLGHSAFIYGTSLGVAIINDGATVSGGIATVPPALVYNQGTIRSPGTAAVFLDGGQITNASGGLLFGGMFGVFGGTFAVTLENAGSIRAQAEFGVFLTAGGTVTNSASGQIYGAARGIYIDDGIVTTAHGSYAALGTVVNEGAIGGSTAAVVIEGGGYIGNLGTGAVMTGSIAAAIIAQGSLLGETSTIVNQGTIHGSVAGAALEGTQGVVLNMGTQSYIYGAQIGVVLQGYSSAGSIMPSMTLYNQGGIYAVSTAAVEMFGGVLINAGTASRISGGTIAVFSSFSSSIENEGLISGQLAGAGLIGGAVVTNAAGATIAGGAAGMIVNGAGYLTNSGTIRGGHAAGLANENVGVFLEGGGTLSNLTGSSFIYGVTLGVALGLETLALDGSTVSIAPVVYNQGSIVSGKNGDAVAMYGGTLTNEGAAAVIKGGSLGVYMATSSLATALVTNQGSITGSAIGITLAAGGLVTNATSGLISGGTTGVDFGTSSSYATLDNAGTILGAAGKGVYLRDGGTLLNTGLIRGASGAYAAGAGFAYVSNEGTIIGTSGVGLLLDENTDLNNLGADARISGTSYGVKLGNGGDILDAGTIAGGTDAILGYGYYTNVGLLPGAVIEGAVNVSPVFLNTLELDSASNTGSIDMGGSFSGFQYLQFEGGARWTLGGTAAELATSQNIEGFTLGDALILDGVSATSIAASGELLTVYQGSSQYQIDFDSSVLGHGFAFTNTAQGTEIIICHLRDTRIATPAGEVAIEDLRIGDLVRTRFGGAQRIKWIGVQHYNSLFLKRDMLPVCISAGALADGVPARDLFVSPGHSLLLNGSLVLARDLLNGVTVTQIWAPDQTDYFNIELETHDCVLAEGAWSETYADCPGLRAKFHNAASFFPLYPGHIVPAEPQLCAPRPLAGPLLAEALAPVLARAAAETCPGRLRGYLEHIGPNGALCGWAQDEANPQLPLWLDILVDDAVAACVLANLPRRDVAEAGFGGDRCGFTWTPPAGVAGRIKIRRHGTTEYLGRLDALAA